VIRRRIGRGLDLVEALVGGGRGQGRRLPVKIRDGDSLARRWWGRRRGWRRQR
jgi:hypothetical protein